MGYLDSDRDRDPVSLNANNLSDPPGLPRDLENSVAANKGRGCTGKDVTDISRFPIEEKKDMKECNLKGRPLSCDGKGKCNDLEEERMCWRVTLPISICDVDIVTGCVKTRVSRGDVYDAIEKLHCFIFFSE